MLLNNLFIRMVQENEFFNVIFQSEFSNKVKGTVRSLCSCKDNYGLLGVGGRLVYSNLSYFNSHPVTLPFKCEQSWELYAGVQQVLFSIRLKYWPINAQAEIKGVIHSCTRCFKSKQLMLHPPSIRVIPVRSFFTRCVRQRRSISYQSI